MAEKNRRETDSKTRCWWSEKRVGTDKKSLDDLGLHLENSSNLKARSKEERRLRGNNKGFFNGAGHQVL